METAATLNPLQAELTRIEEEAARHSRMICEKEDALNAAYAFWRQIAAFLDERQSEYMEPIASYAHSEVSINIYGRQDSFALLQACDAAGITLTYERDGYVGVGYWASAEHPGVCIIIEHEAIERYRQSFEKEAA